MKFGASAGWEKRLTKQPASTTEAASGVAEGGEFQSSASEEDLAKTMISEFEAIARQGRPMFGMEIGGRNLLQLEGSGGKLHGYSDSWRYIIRCETRLKAFPCDPLLDAERARIPTLASQLSDVEFIYCVPASVPLSGLTGSYSQANASDRQKFKLTAIRIKISGIFSPRLVDNLSQAVGGNRSFSSMGPAGKVGLTSSLYHEVDTRSTKPLANFYFLQSERRYGGSLDGLCGMSVARKSTFP